MVRKFVLAFLCCWVLTAAANSQTSHKTQHSKTKHHAAVQQTPAPYIRMVYSHLESFTAIDAQGPFDIHIAGNTNRQRVQIDGERNELLTQMKAEVRNHVLYLSLVPAPNAPKQPIESYPRIDVHLNMHALTWLRLSNAARAAGSHVYGRNWLTIETYDVSSVVLRGNVKLSKIQQNGSGLVDVHWVGSDDLRIYSQGSGTVNVAGTTNYLYSYLDGSARLNARYLRANNVWIRTTGNSFAQVTPLNSLRGFALNNSNIYYYHRPEYLTRFSQDFASVLLAPENEPVYGRHYPRSLK